MAILRVPRICPFVWNRIVEHMCLKNNLEKSYSSMILQVFLHLCKYFRMLWIELLMIIPSNSEDALSEMQQHTRTLWVICVVALWCTIPDMIHRSSFVWGTPEPIAPQVQTLNNTVNSSCNTDNCFINTICKTKLQPVCFHNLRKLPLPPKEPLVRADLTLTSRGVTYVKTH